MGNIAYIRAELERLRQRAALAAEEIHKGTKDLADPEIPVEKKKKTSEDKVKIMVQQALQEIEKLGLADELKKKAKQEEEQNEEKVTPKENNEEEGVENEAKPEEEAEEEEAMTTEKNEKEGMAKLPYEEEGSAKEKNEEEGKANDEEEGVDKEENLRRRLRRRSSYAGLMQALSDGYKACQRRSLSKWWIK